MNQETVSETMDIQRLAGKIASSEGHSAEQVKFFAPDAQVRIYMGEERILELTGLKYLEAGLKNFMSNVKRCHYLIGQHTVDFLTKTKATGRLFCRAAHITEDYGEEIITDYCIYYEDIYEKIHGEWLIKARDTHYLISNKQVLGI